MKTFNYFFNNPTNNKTPATSSMILLFHAETGFPACIMEAAWITGLKTAASTAITAQYLANPNSGTVTKSRAGTLGRMHLRALAERFKVIC